MARLNIPYETLVGLVEQLPSEKQQDLLVRLLEKSKTRVLSKEEKKALFHASILNVPVRETPSVRREDENDE